MYDLIGDIHGHADELEQLLGVLGYQIRDGVYSHPNRKVIFLGDFIDRGPKIRQVLEIVRPMIEEANALAVMGNHELNALAYHTEDPESPGQFLRPHTQKNMGQHCQTVEQLNPREIRAYLDWFRSLPMWLELDGLRVVHACWDDRSIGTIADAFEEHGGITTSLLQSACREKRALFAPVEVVLKGKEVELPNGKFFFDKDKNKRHNIRSRWYMSSYGQTYRSYAFQSDEIDCDLPVNKPAAGYPPTAKPVFVGHYWLSAERPAILADNVACVDYSVAKGGFLCAYRWHGEQKLSNENFVWFNGGRIADAQLPPRTYH